MIFEIAQIVGVDVSSCQSATGVRVGMTQKQVRLPLTVKRFRNRAPFVDE